MSTDRNLAQSLIISPLKVEDKVDFLKLWQGYLDFYASSLPAEITELTWARLLTPDEPMYALGAFNRQNVMLGFVTYVFHRSTWAKNHYCYLEDLYVDASARGMGTGRALIQAVQEKARERNCERLYWATQAGNTAAQALYDKLATKTDFLQYRMPL